MTDLTSSWILVTGSDRSIYLYAILQFTHSVSQTLNNKSESALNDGRKLIFFEISLCRCLWNIAIASKGVHLLPQNWCLSVLFCFSLCLKVWIISNNGGNNFEVSMDGSKQDYSPIASSGATTPESASFPGWSMMITCPLAPNSAFVLLSNLTSKTRSWQGIFWYPAGGHHVLPLNTSWWSC